MAPPKAKVAAAAAAGPASTPEPAAVSPAPTTGHAAGAARNDAREEAPPPPLAGEGEEHEAGDEEGAGEDKETCGFCKFMKAGPCKDVFVAWELCVDTERKSAEGNFVERCLGPTGALKECMEQHPDYYGALLGEEDEGKEPPEGDAPPPESGDAPLEKGAPSTPAGGAR